MDATRRHIEHKAACRELAPERAEDMLALLDAGSRLDYAGLYEAVVFVPLPSVVYHTAPRSARQSIQRQGLVQHAPEDGDFGWRATSQPRGVYVGAHPDLRGTWARTDDWDVWRINLAERDVAWSHDRLNPGFWALHFDVPAELLSLHDRA